MSKKKFTFINNTIETNDESKEASPESIVQENSQIDEAITKKIRKMKQKTIKHYFIGFTISMSASILIFIFGLLWQDDTSFSAIGDSLWLTVILVFFVGWIMLVYNKNIFSPLLYGAKSFFLLFFGQRPKTDYYNYAKKIEENQVPNYYFIITFTTAFIIFIPALITLIILI